MFVTQVFGAVLIVALPADSVALEPYVSQAAYADIKNMLAEKDGNYTFLSLISDDTFETVKAYLVAGEVVLDRGVEGTEAVKHPCGTRICSVSPTIVAAVKALICEYDCCEEGDCDCNPATFSGAFLPEGVKGKYWQGAVLFTGDAPMYFGVSDAPNWISVTTRGHVLALEGTPLSAGEWAFSVAAANCNGTTVATHSLTVVVTEE